MHQRRRTGVWLLTACAALAVLAVTGPALADHTDTQRITDATAFTLPTGDFRIGVWKLEAGVYDNLNVQTYSLPWLVRVFNAGVKYKVYDDGEWAASVAQSLFHLDMERLVGKDGKGITFFMAPFEANGSWRMSSNWALHSGLVYTFMRGDGNFQDADLKGAAALSNLMLRVGVEYRWSERTAFLLEGRSIVAQEVAAATSTTQEIDDFTTVEIVGGVSAEGEKDDVVFGRAFQATASVVWSWSTFNLRLGLVTGDIIVPMINVPVSRRITYPEFDLYWIF